MSNPINTVGDMLITLQDEIDDLKSDRLSESKARLVLGYRRAQLKTAEVAIQYARMLRAKSVSGPALPLLGPSKEEEPKKDAA